MSGDVWGCFALTDRPCACFFEIMLFTNGSVWICVSFTDIVGSWFWICLSFTDRAMFGLCFSFTESAFSFRVSIFFFWVDGGLTFTDAIVLSMAIVGSWFWICLSFTDRAMFGLCFSFTESAFSFRVSIFFFWVDGGLTFTDAIVLSMAIVGSWFWICLSFTDRAMFGLCFTFTESAFSFRVSTFFFWVHGWLTFTDAVVLSMANTMLGLRSTVVTLCTPIKKKLGRQWTLF